MNAIFLAPITWPLLALTSLGIFILEVTFFALALALSIVGFLVIRKSSPLEKLGKIAATIGNKLLEFNTALIYAFLGREPEA